jgi:hypothetical protein
MKLVNLTPHTVNIFNEDGDEVLAVPPSGLVARIETIIEKVGTFRSGIPYFQTEVTGAPYLIDTEGNIRGFPAGSKGEIFIVSGLFRSYFDRPDLYQPGELLRDDDGQVIGCVGLSR